MQTENYSPPSAAMVADSLEGRIRDAIDSASEASAAAAYSGASMHPERLVPVKAVRIDEISGGAFVQYFLPHLEVAERFGSFLIDWEQFCAVRESIFRGVSPQELKKVSQTNAKQTTKKRRYERDGIIITRGNSDRKDGRKYRADMLYYRVQRDGQPLSIRLGRDVNAAFKKARKIKRAADEKQSPIEILEKFMPDSKVLARLRREEQADDQSPPKSSPSASIGETQSNLTSDSVTIQMLVDAYLKGAAKASVEIKLKTAKGNVFRLRDLMEIGLDYKRKPKMTDEDVAADLFSRPVACLTPHVVDKFKDIMLSEGAASSLSKKELMQKKNGVNSTIRQARSLFSKKAKAIYRLAKIEFPFPYGFMEVSVFSTADNEFSLPQIVYIKGIFSELRSLKKTNPDKYLVRLLGLFAGLRPQEVKWLRKDKIRNSGYWYIRIEITDEFDSKGYVARNVPIPEELALEILNTCKDNGSEFVISGHKTYRIKKLFDKINEELREKYLHGVRRPSYELRKFFATGCKLAHGLETTHERMGHKDRKTTEKYYIDRHATGAFLEIYKEWAKELFGGEPFKK